MVSCNDVFTYNTPRYVVIRDWRLGLFYKGLLIGIGCYVLFYQMLFKKAHFLKETPVCSVAFQLKRPTPGPQANWWRASDAARADYPSALAPVSELPYCAQFERNSTRPAGKVRPCEYFDEETIAPGRLRGDTSILLTSRMSILGEYPVCRNNATCAHLYDDVAASNTNVFVADLENYQLLIDHQATSADLAERVVAKSKDIPGARLYSSGTGANRRSWEANSSSGFSEMFGYDVFSVQQLLEAAGVDSLDAMDVSTMVGTRSSYRYEGVTIFLQITYDNMGTYGFGSSAPMYSYKALRMSTYKPSHDAISAQYFGNRTMLNRHGVSVVAQCVGQFGEFDFFSLFTMIASASAMLAVASLVVDRLSILACPMKRYYKTAKYMETEDFTRLREHYAHLPSVDKAELRTLEHLEESYKRTQVASGGDGLADSSGLARGLIEARRQ